MVKPLEVLNRDTSLVARVSSLLVLECFGGLLPAPSRSLHLSYGQFLDPCLVTRGQFGNLLGYLLGQVVVLHAAGLDVVQIPRPLAPCGESNTAWRWLESQLCKFDPSSLQYPAWDTVLGFKIRHVWLQKISPFRFEEYGVGSNCTPISTTFGVAFKKFQAEIIYRQLTSLWAKLDYQSKYY